MIELDQLLEGDCTEAEAMECFRNNGTTFEFHEEHYLVKAIKKHLRSRRD